MKDPSSGAIELGDLNISRLGLDEAVVHCADRITRSVGGYVCFVNVHTLTEATTRRDLREALQAATYCFADGVPLLWLARAKGERIGGRVSGPDFMDRMLRTQTCAHGFIGGLPGRAETIARGYGVRSVTYSPPMRPFSEAAAKQDWAAFLALCPGGEPPPIVWVGLGAPKQERWLAAVSTIVPHVLFLGVGAAFDFLSGAKPRAPLLLQKLGLEWLHRLRADPRRLWSRYLISNSRFLLLAARELSR